MTQSNYLREKQSGLNLQKDKRVCLLQRYGALYERGIDAEKCVCEKLE
jgi:hypothetical protein